MGKLLGLDRVPEVRTLRAKLKHLASRGKRLPGARRFAKTGWPPPPRRPRFYTSMGMCVPTTVHTLPQHYVARERLCLRATADYWVNAMDGQPFFVVSQAVDPGLLQVLEKQIVPRLEREVPGQPSEEAWRAPERAKT